MSGSGSGSGGTHAKGLFPWVTTITRGGSRGSRGQDRLRLGGGMSWEGGLA